MNKQKNVLFSTFIFLLSLFTGYGCDQKQNENISEFEAEINAYVEPFVKARGFSGTILIAKGGEILLSRGYGKANYEWDARHTPEVKFQIASVSKSFTAAAIMILKERGLLTVADPLTRFIPDYPNGEKITIHHLLIHTSGIPNVNEFPDYGRKSRFPSTLEQIIRMFKNKKLVQEPGSGYRYSNSNYNLLAYIIEKVSGQSYGDFLRENIFEPLGMHSTGHPEKAETLVPNRASGYAPTGEIDLKKAPYLDWTIKTGNGSLYSTSEDLYKWDRSLYTEQILKKDTLEKIFKKHVDNVGYGWFVRERLGRRVTAINGRSPGFASYLERYIDDDACIIILSNIYTSAPFAMIEGLAAIVFGEEYEKPVAVKFEKLDSQTLNSYSGRYKFGPDFYRPGAVVTVESNGGQLSFYWSKTYFYPVLPISKDTFLDRMFWAYITFQKNEAGEVVGLIWKDPDEYSAKKLSSDSIFPFQ
jgi:CubicO group peptidase (beta-lactamase class C family)